MTRTCAVVQWVLRVVILGPLFRLRDRPTVTGADRIPRRGPVILVANHQAVSDSFHLAIVARRPVVFLAKSEYFTETGLRGRLKRWFFGAVGQIPVDRDGGGAASDALATARAVVGQGAAWAVHPEGSRVRSHSVHRGHTGALRVAITTGAPVVPVAITGTADGEHWWSRRSVAIRVGDVLDTTGLDADDARAVTDEVMRWMATATGWPYVDTYTPRRGAA